ncbi:putative disease resistance protein RGA3 isoform X2 [Euphorbia lathyris]
MWVCVSDDYDVQLVVKKVLESATGRTPKIAEMDPLKNLLHEKINGRRYLLVLDDVWNEDMSKWLNLKDLLAGGARGSKIVITTRLRKVAEMSQPISIHELRGLTENEAWSLFKQIAFKLGQVPNLSHEAIGREIVAKCYGVPLAIRAVGGMLCSKDLESEWLLYKNQLLSTVYRNDILPILKLSYNHLPSHYKHCFAYCSLYPKDFKIHVEELIRLWKAHGYLKSTDSNECLQDVGYGCFMDLFRLSFFEDVGKDEFGNIIYCRMHDLMHDLATSVAGDKFSTSHSEMTHIKDKTQHMSFRVDQNSISRDFSSLVKAKKIRTVLPLVYGLVHINKEELDSVFCNLRCLRVLNLSSLKINELPSSIYKLKHLRYLDLSNNEDIKKLPDSITNLHNLQVLQLRFCLKLTQLPNNITKLVNLTDLDNYACSGLTHMPQGIGKLTRLEKLSLFVIAEDDSISKYSGGLDELHALNNLRGALRITNLKCVKNAAFEFKAANLSAKKQLLKLTLEWVDFEHGNDNCSADDVANDEMGLEAVCPHQSLKGLSVYRYRGVRPPSWLPSVTNLVSVLFGDCRSIQWLPPFDQLPYLKKLSVYDLINLEYVDVSVNFENGGSSSFFPSLTYLTLRDCPNLKGFVRCKTDVGTEPTSLSMEELPCFPCLHEFQIGGCPSLTYMPLFPKLKILTLMKDGIKSLMEVLNMTTTSASQFTSSPFSSLFQLEDLSIWEMEDCPVDELLQYLPSLQRLEFYDCSCKSLSSDENDDGMQWQSLKVLQYVNFSNMQNLVSLPKGLQYVTNLQRLQIYQCGSLASIPEWMGNLVMLQDLTINYCPQLSERCKNNMAEDWPKISHIPNITIGFQSIQRNG